MSTLTNVVLIAATVTTGLIAGLFFTYSNSGLPGLQRSSDRTFVEGMQQINVAILNPLFLATFMGAMLLDLAAAVLVIIDGGMARIVLAIVGAVLYLATVGITNKVNVPLNNELDAAGPIDKIADVSLVRQRFEARWVRYNIIRTYTSVGAFLALAIALVV
ncbi:putative membrane protein [Herbihabitans rhizosphaerae]|uniref:Putative membrane protein n=1 Tax=Herbihabitans rhizosphaerae TaxID=1872711 RepID=A0A4Q7KE92_9PSEU|nr:anthrone oxygenase family protein [Herbihabitans rhizosphaerae]RZS29530.1 putative membrane protein [Herbihabitans rhizosphaerae]